MAVKNPNRDGDFGEDRVPLTRLFDHEQFQLALRTFEAQSRAGDRTAATNAMRVLWRRGKVPGWLADATDVLTVHAMEEDEKRARRKWRVHQMRSELVTELCERRAELSHSAAANLERARARISSNATDGQERARLVEVLPELVEAARYDWGTTSLDRVREIVSERLGKGHSPGAIKRSCKIVEDAGGEAATFESYLAVLRERGESDGD